VHTTTKPLFEQLFISQLISPNHGWAVKMRKGTKHGITQCSFKLPNGFGKILPKIILILECLSSLGIKMVLFQLQAPLTGLTLLAGLPRRHGPLGWMSVLRRQSKSEATSGDSMEWTSLPYRVQDTWCQRINLLEPIRLYSNGLTKLVSGLILQLLHLSNLSND